MILEFLVHVRVLIEHLLKLPLALVTPIPVECECTKNYPERRQPHSNALDPSA